MRHSGCVIAFMLLLSSAYSAAQSTAAESKPLTQEENDSLIYLQSIGAEPMKWMCQPVLKDMPNFDADLSAWLAQNQEAIGRAKQAQAARLTNGETIQEYETGVQNSIKANLAKTSADRILMQCLGFVVGVTPKKSG